MTAITKTQFLAVCFALLLSGALVGQGVEIRGSAVVLYGSATNTSQPATIDMDAVERRTPEQRTIRSEGVRRGSARYELLIAKMHKRIKRAAAAAAEADGKDCVVRDGDITDARGLEVADLTQAVIDQLESADLTP